MSQSSYRSGSVSGGSWVLLVMIVGLLFLASCHRALPKDPFRQELDRKVERAQAALSETIELENQCRAYAQQSQQSLEEVRRALAKMELIEARCSKIIASRPVRKKRKAKTATPPPPPKPANVLPEYSPSDAPIGTN